MLMIMMIIIIKQKKSKTKQKQTKTKTKTLQFVEVNTRFSFQEEASKGRCLAELRPQTIKKKEFNHFDCTDLKAS